MFASIEILCCIPFHFLNKQIQAVSGAGTYICRKGSAFYQLHVKEEESSRLKYAGYVCFAVFVLTGEPKEV